MQMPSPDCSGILFWHCARIVNLDANIVRNDKKDTAESGIKLLKTLIKVQNKNVPKIRDASFIYCVTFISFFVI